MRASLVCIVGVVLALLAPAALCAGEAEEVCIGKPLGAECSYSVSGMTTMEGFCAMLPGRGLTCRSTGVRRRDTGGSEAVLVPGTPSATRRGMSRYPQDAPTDKVFRANRPIATRSKMDTRQYFCFDDLLPVPCPAEGEPFFGQDAQYAGAEPSLRSFAATVVEDLNTGLVWDVQDREAGERLKTRRGAVAACDMLELRGYDDWRLPSIKELFTLAEYRGENVGDLFGDAAKLAFQPEGRDGAGRRYWSVTDVPGGPEPPAAAYVFDVGRGRIDAVSTEVGEVGDAGAAGAGARLAFRCVRGREYGANRFADNGDGTVTDWTSRLVWQQTPHATAMDWREGLDACERMELAGEDSWRLPNVKELFSLADYGRGSVLDAGAFPGETQSGWFWSSTTQAAGGAAALAAAMCFGECTGAEGAPGVVRAAPKSERAAGMLQTTGREPDVPAAMRVRCVR